MVFFLTTTFLWVVGYFPWWYISSSHGITWIYSSQLRTKIKNLRRQSRKESTVSEESKDVTLPISVSLRFSPSWSASMHHLLHLFWLGCRRQHQSSLHDETSNNLTLQNEDRYFCLLSRRKLKTRLYITVLLLLPISFLDGHHHHLWLAVVFVSFIVLQHKKNIAPGCYSFYYKMIIASNVDSKKPKFDL